MGDSLGLACSKPDSSDLLHPFCNSGQVEGEQSLEEVKSSLVPQDSLYLPRQPEHRYVGAAQRCKRARPNVCWIAASSSRRVVGPETDIEAAWPASCLTSPLYIRHNAMKSRVEPRFRAMAETGMCLAGKLQDLVPIASPRRARLSLFVSCFHHPPQVLTFDILSSMSL
jgi:hypothetical protein